MDKMQQQHSRLLSRRFRQHNDDRFVKLEIAALGTLYAPLIYRTDNPTAAQVIEQGPRLKQKISPYLGSHCDQVMTA